mgnify:CR=1 FL=1
MGQKRKLISNEDPQLEKNHHAREVYATLPNTKKTEFVAEKQQSNCIEDILNRIALNLN